MASKSKKVSADGNLATYQDAIKAYFIKQFGEDPKDPGEPNRIPDSKYIVTVNNEKLSVHIRSGRVAGIGRIPPKVFPALAGCTH